MSEDHHFDHLRDKLTRGLYRNCARRAPRCFDKIFTLPITPVKPSREFVPKSLPFTNPPSTIDIHADIAKRLLAWFDDNGRKDLPWQKQINPYRVWVSEIMLQQTQVSTVIPYFERFIAAFPNVDALAKAASDEVLHLWTGLGYYARARNLHKAAKIIAFDHNGVFPSAVETLVALPGIGQSTAGAIVSIACKGRAPILDGNVKRVLARHFAVAGWPGEIAVTRILWSIAEATTPSERVADYTQGIMDLGATLCTRSRPQCTQCPLSATCKARTTEDPTRFPGKRPKKSIPERHTVFLQIVDAAGSVLLLRRPEAGIWGGLWCFPEVGNIEQAIDWCLTHLGVAPEQVMTETPLTHVFTHFRLHIQPLRLPLPTTVGHIAEGNFGWVKPTALGAMGLPAPVARLLAEFNGSSAD